MTTYVSDIKIINKSSEIIFLQLSNLNNLENLKNISTRDNSQMPNLQDVEFDEDSIRFVIPGLGKVGFRIIEREPFKVIKLKAEGTPVSANGWIQLVPIADDITKMRLTIKAELPLMIKAMVNSKLEKGINTIADAIASAFNVASEA